MLTFAYSLEPSSYNIIASVSEGATGQALDDGSQGQEAPNDGIVARTCAAQDRTGGFLQPKG